MCLLWGNIIDARMVMLAVVPMKILGKILPRLHIVKKPAGISMESFHRAECRFNERVVIGGSWSGKQLRHAMVLQQLANRFCLHLPASIIDQFRSLLVRKIEDIFSHQSIVKQPASRCAVLPPADQPGNDLPGIFVKQQIQVQKQAFLKGRQIADVPAPPLVRPVNSRRNGGTDRPLCARWQPRLIIKPAFLSTR